MSHRVRLSAASRPWTAPSVCHCLGSWFAPVLCGTLCRITRRFARGCGVWVVWRTLEVEPVELGGASDCEVPVSQSRVYGERLVLRFSLGWCP